MSLSLGYAVLLLPFSPAPELLDARGVRKIESRPQIGHFPDRDTSFGTPRDRMSAPAEYWTTCAG